MQSFANHRSYLLSRGGVVFIWGYQGLVPKLIFRDPTELALVEQGPVIHTALTTVLLAGLAECLLACLVLVLWRQRWPLLVSLLAFIGLLGGALTVSPALAIQAFNPVTLSGSGALFCLIALGECKTVPHCA